MKCLYKHHDAATAELCFSNDRWETVHRSPETLLLKPRYMVSHIDWSDLDSISQSRSPFVHATYSGDKLVKIDASAGAVRELPLFYSVQNKRLFLSDRPEKVIGSDRRLDKLSVTEFLGFGYVTSDRTLFENVYSLEAGNILSFGPDGVRISIDFLYNTAPISDEGYEDLLSRLSLQADLIFDDVIKTVSGKTVLLPLSAGYDSRFIACMLKIGGFQDVKCFAWGSPGNPDLAVSKAIAAKFGYAWEVVNASEDHWKEVLDADWVTPVLTDASSFTSISGAASFPFQQLLRERAFTDAVVLPGHTGDFLCGSHVPQTLHANSTLVDVAEGVKAKHLFRQGKGNDCQLTEELISQLKRYCDFTDTHRCYETWEQRERQSKFIANTNRYYEAIGCSWCMPFWDVRFISFWDEIPLCHKRSGRLYRQFLEQGIFKKTGVDFHLKGCAERSVMEKWLARATRLCGLRTLVHTNRKKPLDEYGFWHSLPFLYKKTMYKHPDGFRKMSNFCTRLRFEEPQRHYEFLARSVLAMLLDKA